GIIVFQVFENVADVQERITIEADVHESRLHAGEDPGDFSLVDAAAEREFFLPADLDFDYRAFFENRDPPFVGGRGNNQFFRHENSLCVTPALPEFTTGRIAASFCPSEVREIGAGPVCTGTHVGHTGRGVAWRSKPEAMVSAVPGPPV